MENSKKYKFKNRIVKSFLLTLLMVLIFGMTHCGSGATDIPGGGNELAPPAPPIQLPTFVTFPESIGIELQALDIEEGLATASLSFLVGAGGEFSEIVAFGADLVQNSFSSVDNFLNRLAELQIPVGVDVTTFEDVADVEDNVIVKIDFADFDLDGDGVVEGCTGCTCPVGCGILECPEEAEVEDINPICYRIWVDIGGTGQFQRYIAGIMTEFPILEDETTAEIEANAGAGAFITGLILPGPMETPLSPPGVHEEFSSVIYDHRDFQDEFRRSTEISSVLQEFYFDSEDPVISLVNRFKIDREGLDGAISEDQTLTTINLSLEGPVGESTSIITIDYVAQYIESEGYWIGTVLAFDEAIKTEDFSNQCVELLTGEGVDQQLCTQIGLDVSNIPVIDKSQVLEETGAFPVDFPETPTF